MLCGVQYLVGWLRGKKCGLTEVARTGTIRGDHNHMTFSRAVLEHLHTTIRYVCLIVALVAVFSGLWMINAPRWM